MVEDQLTRDERIRLESLALSVTVSAASRDSRPLITLDRAKEFEQYIRGPEAQQ